MSIRLTSADLDAVVGEGDAGTTGDRRQARRRAIGTFRGTIRGPATAVETSVTPTSQPGIVVAVVDLVIHDRKGDLRCAEIVVVNTTPGSDSEEGWICQIQAVRDAGRGRPDTSRRSARRRPARTPADATQAGSHARDDRHDEGGAPSS